MNFTIIAAAWIIVGGQLIGNPNTNAAGAYVVFCSMVVLSILGVLI